MCFHLSSTPDQQQIEAELDLRFSGKQPYFPFFHTAAYEYPFIPVLREGGGYHDSGRSEQQRYAEPKPRELTMLRWGLIPHWVSDKRKAEDIRKKTFNARKETAREKPSFRDAAASNRCVVVADGFFEWHEHGGKKYPFYLRYRDGGMIFLGAIWSQWLSPEGEREETVSILTTGANMLLSRVHNHKERMPVLLDRGEIDEWIDDPRAYDRLTSVREAPRLEAYPVGKQAVFGNSRRAIEPVDYPELSWGIV
ncbi:MAG: SOS response-associated peptidase [Spirochaetales bacterium]|nr:SOS response-associated peptidase [Spirochaetales bacterium]MCF7937459.1 SOS response-associated peptidase [Spirochaetales bacterium]